MRLLGNVELGRDISYGELKALYDVVVLAVGAQVPRPLGIPGENLPGVANVIDFVGWYNGVPGSRDYSTAVDAEAAVVVGNGNVALDVARIEAGNVSSVKGAGAGVFEITTVRLKVE